MQGNTVVYTLDIPSTAPAGLFVPRVTVENSRALTPSGKPRGILFLQPVRIVNETANAAENGGSLDVSAVAVTQISTQMLQVQLAWQTERPFNRNLNVNIRLTDANGNFLRLLDRQPGDGFLPTVLWPVNQPVYDWLTMPLPGADEGHQLPFVLVAQLYDVTAPNQSLLTRRLGELTRQDGRYDFQPTTPQFDLPQGIVRETAVFGDIIQLQGYTLYETVDSIEVTLVWQALANGQIDYTRFVHLIDAANPGPPIVNNDSMPRNGSYPTSQWTAGELITETISLSLVDVPAGEYQVAVGYYVLQDGVFERLTAVDIPKNPLPENRFIFSFIVER
jgi:hypothetical protein